MPSVSELPKLEHIAKTLHERKRTKLVAIVQGLPGSGKTRSIISLLHKFNSVVIFCEPRRQLRKWAYIEIMNRGMRAFEFVAKDELENCPLKGVDTEDWLRYVRKCLEFKRAGTCSECPFVKQIRELIAFSLRGGVIVTTHLLLPLVNAVTRPDVIIVDEAEELINSLSNFSIDEETVNKMLEEGDEIDKEIAKHIVKKWYYDPSTRRYWFRISVLKAPLIVFLSATWKKPFESLLQFRYIPRYYEVRTRNVAKQFIIYNIERLVEDRMGEWFRQYLQAIGDIAEESVLHGLTVGIVTRKNEFADKIGYYLLGRGIDAYWGGDYRKARDHNVVIIVPGNKLFRGLSLDRDVVICDFQHHDPLRMLHPAIEDAASTVFSTPITDFNKLLCQAQNVQAYFRFIRVHSKPHIIVMLDARAYEATHKFFRSYIEKYCEIEQVRGLQNAVAAFRRVLPRALAPKI
ncbi:MAG: hypothetical protein J7K15_10320 [Deltaproteobacteria bacterium]|nr:hypothetical protein [Deltaproteobacteria bacterium]